MIVILMGVSGVGKTTVGELLAQQMGWRFYDGDSFHPEANVDKMSRGMALTDDDRWPWLEALRDHFCELAAEGHSAVVACSALKASYRDCLLAGHEEARLVYLKGSYDLIKRRLQARSGHFFDAELLASQFEALEETAYVTTVEVDQEPEQVVEEIVRRLGLDEEAEEQDDGEADEANERLHDGP